MKLVAFDESGNTGPDLLNEDQPVFILSSADLTIDEAEELLTHVRTKQASEVKFKDLKKSNAGKNKILNFLEKAKRYTERIGTTFYHKQYMVFTKIVDMLIESILHRDGIDIYKNGFNIATANYHYNCMPAFIGQYRTKQFLNAFVAMIRQNDQSSIDHFYAEVRHIYAENINIEYLKDIALILKSESIIQDILKHNGSWSIDPAIPSFFEHCTYWGDKFGEHFDVLHDKSKIIFQKREDIEPFMSKDIPHAEIGYDRRKFGFPLKANGISFGDSKKDPRLQVVDIVAGSSSYWANGLATEKTEELFFKQLDELGMPLFTINALWPSMALDMGTVYDGGVNPASYMAEQLSKLKKTNLTLNSTIV